MPGDGEERSTGDGSYLPRGVADGSRGNEKETGRNLLAHREHLPGSPPLERLPGRSAQVGPALLNEGLASLRDRSCRPHHLSDRASQEVAEKVCPACKRTGFVRKRLAWYLWREEGLAISPPTIRHILRSQGFLGRKKKRRTLYPAHWAWEQGESFTLAQVDVEDILDKTRLRTILWDHLRKADFLYYQWMLLEGRTRFGFLLTVVNDLCFAILLMTWLRAWRIKIEVDWQEDKETRVRLGES